MRIDDFKKKQLAILRFFKQEYPLPNLMRADKCFYDSMNQNKKLSSFLRKYNPSFKRKDELNLPLSKSEKIVHLVNETMKFEIHSVPEQFTLENYAVVKSKNIEVYGNKMSLPEFTILDYGLFPCDCEYSHAKIAIVFGDEVLYIDYIVEQNEMQEVSPHEFWNKTIHPDHYKDHEVLKEPYLLFTGKPWSYSTKITENDNINSKLKRTPKELERLKPSVKNIQENIPKGWKIGALHFSKGWEEKSGFISPFFILYVGTVENESYCNCSGLHKKYIMIKEGRTLFLDFCATRKLTSELDEKHFWQGKIIEGKSCH